MPSTVRGLRMRRSTRADIAGFGPMARASESIATAVVPGFLNVRSAHVGPFRNWLIMAGRQRKASTGSIRGGTASGQKTGDQGHQAEEQRGSAEGHRIARPDAGQHAGNRSCGGKCRNGAQDPSPGDHRNAIPQYEAQHLCGPCPKRHPHSNLPSTFADGVSRDTIESDAGQYQGHDSQRAHQAGRYQEREHRPMYVRV